ncbi:zinc finger protein 878-like isoform X2 [Dysidea avara]|uniref:zinc finger protein 878-like isoform X2 n=1 Tax=Dysidea avara TaxID=196820 RepID=UPI00331F39FE
MKDHTHAEFQISQRRKLANFSIRLNRLKDIPTTLKPRHCENSGGDTNDSNIDDAIFCLDCGKSYHGDCPVHGPLIPLDESQGWDQDSQSYTSVPVPLQVTVKMSSIMNAGKGVFAKEFIPRRTRIGPYKGEVVQKEDVTDETDTSYFWEIKKTGTESYYIDAKNEEHASWLRFINCARSEEEQNLLSFQYQGNIYCYTIKDILPDTELLVWYGEQYVKLLELPVDHIIDANYTCAHCQKQFVEKYNFDIHLRYSQACRDANPQVFKCGKCGEIFTTLINLQQHIRRHEQTSHQTYSSCQEVSNPSTSQTPLPGSDSEHFPSEFCCKSFTQNEVLQEHIYTLNENHHCEGQFLTCDDRQSHTRDHARKKPHQLQCQYCSKSFRERSKLSCHLLIHTGEKPHQCHYCQKAFPFIGSLKRHLRIHTGEKPYICKLCSKSFTTSSGLKRHVRTHSGEKPHQCQYCQKAFTDKETLKKHLRKHTGEKPYSCEHCSKSFVQFSALKIHLRTHIEHNSFKCERCSKEFKSSSGLQYHVRTHTGEKPHQCQHCQKTFIASSALRIHERRNHTGKPYQCGDCSKSFASPTRLKYHMRIHTGERPYQCQYCQKSFTINCVLTNHLKTHTGENLKYYDCQHCSKTFKTSTSLQHHMTSHSSEKPFQCQLCQKAFSLNCLLKRHLKAHMYVLEKHYSCQYCSRKFASCHGLKYHTASHTGEKPYQCHHCQKTFVANFVLQKHLKVHSGEKPYHCQYCSKAFTLSSGLKYHLATHTGEKPYNCRYCSKAYARPDHLKRHMKRHHETVTHTSTCTK